MNLHIHFHLFSTQTGEKTLHLNDSKISSFLACTESMKKYGYYFINQVASYFREISVLLTIFSRQKIGNFFKQRFYLHS